MSVEGIVAVVALTLGLVTLASEYRQTGVVFVATDGRDDDGFEFPGAPACSDPPVAGPAGMLLVEVDAMGDVLELPLTAGWRARDVLATIAEIRAL